MGIGKEQISEFVRKHARTALLVTTAAGIGGIAAAEIDYHTNTTHVENSSLRNEQQAKDNITFFTGGVLFVIAGPILAARKNSQTPQTAR